MARPEDEPGPRPPQPVGRQADRDEVDLTSITSFLRRRRLMRPPRVETPVLVPGEGAPPAGPAPGAASPVPGVATGAAPPKVGLRPGRDEIDEVDLAPLIAWARRRDPVRWALGAMVVIWSLVFIRLGFQRHDRFATFGFDLGIYDQALWLMSRFKTPFVTLRGLNFWGAHTNPGLLFLVPFYWFGAGPHFLLIVQVASQGAGAIAVYLLARDLLEERWPAVALAAVLLLHPTYQYLQWEYFHPEALALGPLLFAYWAARARRWRWFAVAAVLAVACKEDVALVMIVLGLLIAWRGDRRIGWIVSTASAVWFIVATRIIIPLGNGVGPFYDTFSGEFGNSPGEVMSRAVTHPGQAFDAATRPGPMNYLRMMFAPVAFLPLAGARTLLIGVPILAINVLSSYPYQHEIRYHYAALVLAAVMLATVEGIAAIARTPTARAFLIGLVAATALASTVAWGPSPLSVEYHSGLWALSADPRQAAREHAVDLVPARASVSVHYLFAPHMTHRERIYEWPVPWIPQSWGVRGENLHDPAGVDWLIVDRTALTEKDTPLFTELLAGEFVVRYESQGIVVAQRARPGVRRGVTSPAP